MSNKKSNTTMTFTDAQNDLFDFVLNVLNHGMTNKSAYVVDCLRRDVKNYIGIQGDLEVSVPDERLVEVAINKNEALIKSLIGEEEYNKFIKGDEK